MPATLLMIFLLLRSASFVLLLAAPPAALSPDSVEQRFAMEPQDQTAIVGSRVTLPCRVLGKTGLLQWTKDDFGLGTHRNLSGFERYAMVGSDEEGDFSLDIYPVMLDDDARYQCQVSPGPLGQPGIRSQFAVLSVLVPPEPPKIAQGDLLLTTEDREIELECSSVGGKPAAEITWIDGMGNVLTSGIESFVEPLPDGRRFTSRSVLKLTPKKDHHNTTFTCQAQNTADRTYRAAKLRLEVKFAPKVSVAVIGIDSYPGGRIPEGSEVRLSCKAEANPSELTYKWYINDEPVVGDYTTEMVMYNVTRAHHDAIVKCEVHNIVGKSEESETLDISYGPRFRSRPRSVQADNGATVALSCDVDGNPTPDIVWIHEESEKVVGNSANLTLSVVPETAGRYYCKASVPGFHEIGARASVHLRGPPEIASGATQFGITGDTVRLECIARSVPRPQRVSWSRWGRDIEPGSSSSASTLSGNGGLASSDDAEYSVLEDPLPDGLKSTLIVRDSRPKHFGEYNCTAANEYGADVLAIRLVPKKTFPMLLIIVGAVAGVILIVVITLSAILCQKRKRRRHHHENNGRDKKPSGRPQDEKSIDGVNNHTTIITNQCRDSDRSSNVSDLKLELREDCYSSNQEYSEAGSDGGLHRAGVGVPLAGPVALPGGELYRYSADYTEPHFPPKSNDGQNNNGYVPYVDYSRDYNPPSLTMKPALQPTLESSRESLQSTRLHLNSLHSNNSLSSGTHINHHPQLIPNGGIIGGSLTRRQNSDSSSYPTNSLQRATTDSRHENGLPSVMPPAMHEMAVLQNGGCHPSGIDPRYSATYGNPYLRTSNASLPPPSTANPSATPAPPPYSRRPTGPPDITGAAPQVARLPNSPTSQYIVTGPSQVHSVKKGTLATHV